MKLTESSVAVALPIIEQMTSSGEFVKTKGDPNILGVLRHFEKQPDFHIFLLKDADAIYGLTSTFPNQNPGRISLGYTYILPKYRGRGLGIQIRTLILDWLKLAGFKEVYTKTWTGNKSMIAINKKMGFVQIGEEKNTRINGDGTLKFLYVLN
jgi:RimJ/RimL family protein N-acetyltransferase